VAVGWTCGCYRRGTLQSLYAYSCASYLPVPCKRVLGLLYRCPMTTYLFCLEKHEPHAHSIPFFLLYCFFASGTFCLYIPSYTLPGCLLFYAICPKSGAATYDHILQPFWDAGGWTDVGWRTRDVLALGDCRRAWRGSPPLPEGWVGRGGRCWWDRAVPSPLAPLYTMPDKLLWTIYY